MSRFLTEFFEAVPWFLPGIAVWTVASALLMPATARALRTRPPVALAITVSLGFVVLATLTPNAAGLAGETVHGCNLARVGLPPLSELTAINDTIRNIVLFMPLGFTLGLLPRTRRTTAVIGLALAAPFVIETLQLLLPSLGRGCQSADVIDNAIGLAIGIGAAILLRLAHGWWSRRSGPRVTEPASG